MVAKKKVVKKEIPNDYKYYREEFNEEGDFVRGLHYKNKSESIKMAKKSKKERNASSKIYLKAYKNGAVVGKIHLTDV